MLLKELNFLLMKCLGMLKPNLLFFSQEQLDEIIAVIMGLRAILQIAIQQMSILQRFFQENILLTLSLHFHQFQSMLHHYQAHEDFLDLNYQE